MSELDVIILIWRASFLTGYEKVVARDGREKW